MPTEDIVVVGRIGSPYGVQGWVNLQSFTSPAENILSYRPWFLRKAETSTPHNAWRSAGNVRVRAHKKGFVASFDGVTDRDTAAALTGRLIGVPAASLPEVAVADEYYWRDLAGCRVFSVSGEDLGRVDHLLETGANDVLVVKNQAGGDLLIPFAAEYVPRVDMAAQIITVDWDPTW